MTIRLFVETPLAAGLELPLPAGPARHAQVRRVQPGDALVLFDGRGGEWLAAVVSMGRNDVRVAISAHVDVDRELPSPVTLAIGMPANDRMDALVEKATELGVAAIQPLVCERSVLRLDGERAERKREHWHGVAVASCEQSGRTRLPLIHPVLALPVWLLRLGAAGPTGEFRWLLSPAADAGPCPPVPVSVPAGAAGLPRLLALSGPEGGLSPAEEALAMASGFNAITLGARVLRADTAPLALLAWWALVNGGAGAPLSQPAATIDSPSLHRS
jgi:16S rRNA (uracil1498-N3)-methyltransferase